jgi:hypothetical protein
VAIEYTPSVSRSLLAPGPERPSTFSQERRGAGEPAARGRPVYAHTSSIISGTLGQLKFAAQIAACAGRAALPSDAITCDAS